jgi:cytochrome c biogenesis protein CcmG/thiol:disulfide interchange protein DsbE
MKKLLLILPLTILVIIVFFGLISVYKHNKIASIANKLESGQVVFVPAFSLPELYNQELNFSNQDLKGKYSLINVFASWCFNCQKEHALLMQLARSGKVDIYGVAWRDVNKNTKEYLAKNGNPYLKVGIDSKGIFSKLLSVSGTPENFLVNPEGQVIYYWRGEINQDIILKRSELSLLIH